VARILFACAMAGCARGQKADVDAGVARRVVSVSPGTTEALFAIGARERVVGRSRFDDWPKEALALPIVGGFVNADLEAILQLQPDLVVGAPGPASVRLADQLRARGVASWFPSIDSFDAIDQMMLGLGDRTGHAGEARAVVQRLDDASRAVERAVAAQPSPRVLVVFAIAPIVAAGPHDFVDDMVRRARATNVLDAGGPWQTLGFEQVIQLDPDVVIDASHVQEAVPSAISATAQGWKDLHAVQQGHVVPLHDPTAIRPGPRVAEGLAALARALHPGVAVPGP
jgi:iron complex transport system substrate-binding protein